MRKRLFGSILSLFCCNIFAAEPVILAQNYASEITIPGYTAPGTPPKSVPENSPAPTATVPELNLPSAPVQENTKPAIVPASKESLEQLGVTLIENAYQLWTHFLDSLGKCSPGVFILPQLSASLAETYSNIETATIKGTVGDSCQVTMIYYNLNDPKALTANEDMKIQPIGKACSIDSAMLVMLVAQYSAYLQNGTVKPMPDIMENLLAKQCTPIMGPLNPAP